MGWDCTFHLVDPPAISASIAALVGGEPAPASLIEAYPERGAELWAEAGRRVLADPVDDACQIACQIAIYLASAALPHHYERGVALSFGFDPSPPRRSGCWVPDSCMASPELMFEALVARRPELGGRFRTCFESNCDTGVFIPIGRTELAARAVRGHLRDLDRNERKRFLGLLRVLNAATRHGLAFWEASDLGVAQTRAELLVPPPRSKKQRTQPAAPPPSRLDQLLASKTEGSELLEAALGAITGAAGDSEDEEIEAWLASKATKHARSSAGIALIARFMASDELARRRAAASMLAKTYKRAKAGLRDEMIPLILAGLAHDDPVVRRHALETPLAGKHLDAPVFAAADALATSQAEDREAMLALVAWMREALLRKWRKRESPPELGALIDRLLASPLAEVREATRAALSACASSSAKLALRDPALTRLAAHAARELRDEDLWLTLDAFAWLEPSLRAEVLARIAGASTAVLDGKLIRRVFGLVERDYGCSEEVAALIRGLLVHADARVRERAVEHLDRLLGWNLQLGLTLDLREAPASIARAIIRHWRRNRADCEPQLAWLVETGHAGLIVEALDHQLSKYGPGEGFVGLILGLGATLENCGAPDHARAVARLGFRHQPHPDFLYNECCALLTAGEVETAAEVFTRAVELDPKQAADARADPTFGPYFDHPLFEALLAPDRGSAT